MTGEAAGGPPEEGLVAGAMRGGCTYSGEAGSPMVMISAYDAKDREATLAMVDSEPGDGAGFDQEASVEAAKIVLDNL